MVCSEGVLRSRDRFVLLQNYCRTIAASSKKKKVGERPYIKPVNGQYVKGTAEHCCICIPGRACVEHFDDLLHPPPPRSGMHIMASARGGPASTAALPLIASEYVHQPGQGEEGRGRRQRTI